MGIQIVDGRSFSENVGQAQYEAVLNQEAARRYYSGGGAVDRMLNPSQRVVGIVGNMRFDGISSAAGPEVYQDIREQQLGSLPGNWGAFFVVRTQSEPSRLIPSVRTLVQEMHPEATIDIDVASMQERLSESILMPRLNALVLALFAGIATLIAATGIYGVVAYIVGQNIRSVAIRIALGATPSRVWRLMVRQATGVIGPGMLLGITSTLIVNRFLARLFYDLTPFDPVTFLVGLAIFALVAALATYLPVRSAIRTDPLLALREE
jgi:hypothetical protein